MNSRNKKETAQLKSHSPQPVNQNGGQHASPPPFQLKAEKEEQENGKAVQQKAESGPVKSAPPASPGGNGDGLPGDVQSKMENSFGQDFSGVKVHTNSSSATEMGAQAYAQGNSVHFAPGKFNPGSQKGQELIGHELSHVVQQREGRVAPTTQAKGVNVNNDKGLEKEADEQGAKAAKGEAVQMKAAGGGTATPGDNPLQRDPDPNGTKTHVVQSGEMPDKIAEKYGVTVEDLKAANADKWKRWTATLSGFNAGVTIIIPAPATHDKEEVVDDSQLPVEHTQPNTDVNVEVSEEVDDNVTVPEIEKVDPKTITDQLPADDNADKEETTTRSAETRRRVDANSNADNRAHNRWNVKGKDSKYVTKFYEEFKKTSKTFFGEELTHAQVTARIEKAKSEGRADDADSLRKKLFKANQYAIVETLDVTSNSLYKKGGGNTYCNIYAYDVVTAMGAYLPRIWWNSDTEAKIQSGKLKEEDIPMGYRTQYISEMSANMLTEWMPKHGTNFGWEKASSMKAAQDAANEGFVAIILAANKSASKSGHVNVILAETDDHKSKTHTDGSTLPLQSQAGGTNFKHSTYDHAKNPQWWANSSHKDGAAWICKGQPNSPFLGPEQIGLSGDVGEINTEDKAADAGNTTNQTTTPANTTTNDGGNTTGNTTHEEKKSTTTSGGTTEKKDDKTIVLSTGILPMTSEGSFSGKHDVKRPHFPENLYVFRKATSKDAEKPHFTKDSNNRFKSDGSGAWVVSWDPGPRYELATYSKKLKPGEVMGTKPNNSGPTIGFGFDLGARYKTTDQADAKKDLLAAGIPENQAAKLSTAAGLRGLAAAKKTAELRGAITITNDQALKLLNVAMPSYKKNFTPGSLEPVLEEVLVYINYWQGSNGAKSEINEIKAAVGDKKGVEQLKAARTKISGWAKPNKSKEDRSYYERSFFVMYQFLGEMISKMEAGYKIEVTKEVSSVEKLLGENDDTFETMTEFVDDTHLDGKDLGKQLTGQPSSTNTKKKKPKPKPKPSGGNTTTTTSGTTTTNSGTKKKKPAEDPNKKASDFITKKYKQFRKGTIGMVSLAKAMKPYAKSHGKYVHFLLNKLEWDEKDNFSYALAKNSTFTELCSYYKPLLKQMSSELDTWLSWSWDENGAQKKRVDKAIGKKTIDETKKKVSEWTGNGGKDKKPNNGHKSVGNFKLSSSVGKKADNYASDVKQVQDLLVALNYLPAGNKEIAMVEEKIKSDPKTKIPEASLPETIKAIYEYQKLASTIKSGSNAKDIFQGDGNIGKGGTTATSMQEMARVNDAVGGNKLEHKEIANTLSADQWRSQFRFGKNFRDGKDEKEAAYRKYIKDEIGLDDPADLANASKTDIDKVGAKYGTSSDWFSDKNLGVNAIRTKDKARPNKPNYVCCWDATRRMLEIGGVTAKGSDRRIQTFVEDVDNGKWTNQLELGMKYIDSQLAAGNPLFVGIDKGKDKTHNESTTDHYIVIVGKHKDGDKWYYEFFDPGRGSRAKGVNQKNNRLYIGSDNQSVENTTRNYKLSQIRVNDE